mmetsp:Transcript_98661/g.318100  ORF Transcript_98661/g.318100 Transcript_98661/m.318100 type:complete len:343 (+) Transcript_98661:820-1848(+)
MSASGAMFKGLFQMDAMHGEGSYKFADGRLYTGQWREGHLNGHGKMEWLAGADPSVEGNVYEGQWKDDLADGYGKFIHNDGATYQGEWMKDEQSGKGFEIWTDGSRYDGDFLHGAKHGSGIWKSHHAEYRGEFRADEMEGEGRYIFADGRLYIGQWKKGQMHGQGEMDWPNGAKYKGAYQQDLQHGEGAYTYPDGREYRGQWKSGKQHGNGVMSDGKGTTKSVRFRDGKEVVSGRFGFGRVVRSRSPSPASPIAATRSRSSSPGSPPSAVGVGILPSPTGASDAGFRKSGSGGLLSPQRQQSPTGSGSFLGSVGGLFGSSRRAPPAVPASPSQRATQVMMSL